MIDSIGSDVKYSMSTTHSPMSGMKIVKDNATIGQDGNHTLKSDTFTKASGDEASSAKLNNQFPQEAFSPKGPTVYIPRIPKISVNQREDSENQK